MSITKSLMPKSLARTASSGEMNVFLVLEIKATKELLVVSREQLPPVLRLGKLLLNQKVTFRDQNRQNVESSIVYMHTDQQVCHNAKQQMLQTRKPKENVIEAQNLETLKSSSSDQLETTPSNINKQSGKTSTQKITNHPKQKGNVGKELPTTTANTSAPAESQPADLFDIEDFSLSNSEVGTTIDLIEKNDTALDFDEDVEFLSNLIQQHEDGETDCLLQEIQKLTLKIKQQDQTIKERDAEIKRLKSTTINMPTEESAREFIIHLANRIKLSMNGFKYHGNLNHDAKKLGLKVEELKKLLDEKNSISTTARHLFKKMVPSSERQVDHWNKLGTDVLMKEKVLLNFLERYFGPIEADQKKLHTSLVGCLRNQRGMEKKQKHQESLNDDSVLDDEYFEMKE